MKNLMLGIVLSILSVGVNAAETSEKKIERIQIQGNSSNGIAKYYFYNSTGWGSIGCENAKYAYMEEEASGAKAMLSLAMTSKVTGTNVKFLGSCEPEDNAYFIIDYMYQM